MPSVAAGTGTALPKSAPAAVVATMAAVPATTAVLDEVPIASGRLLHGEVTVTVGDEPFSAT